MKNKIKIYLVLFLAIIYACDDPYKDSTFTVYDEVPIATYLESRPEDFSEWVQILKYTDMYNALNQSSEIYTVLVPNNKAVYTFYENKNISSVEELGVSYARELVKYHILRDSVSLDDFTAGGMLTNATLTDDYLEVTFSDEWEDESGFDALYVNGEAHVAELAIDAANGLIYVLDDVMRPMIESIYEQMREEGKNTIMLEAMRLTGWSNELEIVADTVNLLTGATSIQRRYYTVLAVPDEVYEASGISSAEALATKVGAGTDYTNPDNALYQYIGYHILQASYKVDNLQSFDMEDDVCKLWETSAANTLIKTTLEADGKYYFNYEAGSQNRASLLIQESDIMVKNGYFHQLDNILPVFSDFTPVKVVFDVTVFPELAAYISANGVDGQIYQGLLSTQIYTDIPEDIGCYTYEVGPLGTSFGLSGPIGYWTNQTVDYFGGKVLNNDALIIAVGYKGHAVITTPPMVPGKYKVSMQYFYGTSMNPLRNGTDSNTNGGQTTFDFTNMDQVQPKTLSVFSAISEDTLGMYMIDLFEEVEFTTLSKQPLKITLNDPAASTHVQYRLMIDYIVFEPID